MRTENLLTLQIAVNLSPPWQSISCLAVSLAGRLTCEVGWQKRVRRASEDDLIISLKVSPHPPDIERVRCWALSEEWDDTLHFTGHSLVLLTGRIVLEDEGALSWLRLELILVYMDGEIHVEQPSPTVPGRPARHL